MNLRIRITFGFLIIVFVMTCVSGIIIWQESKMQQSLQQSLQLSEIEKYFLECRRQEKNFLIRQDVQSVMLFTSNYDSLNGLVSKMIVDESNKEMIYKLNTLNSKIETYSFDFKKIINSSQVGIDNVIVHEEVMLAREIHTIIKEIKFITIQDFNKAHAVTNNVNIFSILIGLFLSVIIAGFISSKIMDILGRPDDYLTTNR